MRSGFYNSEIIGYDDEGMPIFDKAQDAEFFASFFESFFTNGVFPTPATAFQVIAGSGMTVLVNPGRAFIEGYFSIEDEERSLIVQAAQNLDRIDRVVLRLNLVDRSIDLYIKQGVASSTPVAPTLTRWSDETAGDIYELGIADLFISANSTGISQQRITDLRLNSDLCGIVTQTVQQLNTNIYYAQLTAMLGDSKEEFENWFETIKGILDEETAGHLLNLIQILQGQVADIDSGKSDRGWSKEVILQNTQWFPSGIFPYVQTINDSRIKATDRPLLYLSPNDTTSLASRKANQEQYAKIKEIVAYDGYVQVRCYEGYPSLNMLVTILFGDYTGTGGV